VKAIGPQDTLRKDRILRHFEDLAMKKNFGKLLVIALVAALAVGF